MMLEYCRDIFVHLIVKVTFNYQWYHEVPESKGTATQFGADIRWSFVGIRVIGFAA